jgi:hypothetical protein
MEGREIDTACPTSSPPPPKPPCLLHHYPSFLPTRRRFYFLSSLAIAIKATEQAAVSYNLPFAALSTPFFPRLSRYPVCGLVTDCH